MTAKGGRRAATTRGPVDPVGWITLGVLAVLVLLTVGLLAVAGTASSPTAVRHRGETTTTPAERQLVCPSSDTDTTSYVGLLPGTSTDGSVTASGQKLDLAAGSVATVGAPGRDPLTVTARGDTTRGVFATRVKQAGGMTRCGSPRASWWFAGAGASPGHFSTLELVNPRSGPAVADVTVWGPDGQVDGAGLRGIAVPSGGAKSLDLANAAPASGNLAVHVEVSRGLLVADVEDHAVDVLDPTAGAVAEWIPDQAGPAEHHVLSGLPPPAAETTGGPANPALPPALREGASLVLANPGDNAVVARVRLSGKDGAFTPKGLEPTSVPPQSVVSVPLGTYVDAPGTSVLVDADGPVAAGYVVPGSGDLVHAVSATPWSGPAAVALPKIGTKTLMLTARGVAGTATVTQLGPLGTQLARSQVDVAARTTVGTKLRPDTASVVVTTDGVVVGSVLVDRNGSFAALPLTPVLASLRVPEVRPAGQSSAG
jgi:hypothetical protein